MTCEFRTDVAAQLLGGLPPAEALHVDQHVLTCEECAAYRHRTAIVRTLLDGMERDAPDPAGAPVPPGAWPGLPAGHADETVRRMLRARREPAPSGRLVPFLAGVAAAVVVGVLPLAAWTWTQRPAAPQAVELVGTAAAPDAWGEVTLHARAEGTIVDFEAGDLPRDPGRYLVTVEAGGAVVAQQELTVGTDGWGQLVLTTEQPLTGGYTVSVTRRDGPRLTPVLRCECGA